MLVLDRLNVSSLQLLRNGKMAIRLKRATHLKGATRLKRVMHASRLYSRPQIVFNLTLEKVACVSLLLRWGIGLLCIIFRNGG